MISIHFSIPVVFRLYGNMSPHPGEIPPLVRWDFTITVVLRSSCKLEMKIQRILLEVESHLSAPSLASEVFPHMNRPLVAHYFNLFHLRDEQNMDLYKVKRLDPNLLHLFKAHQAPKINFKIFVDS